MGIFDKIYSFRARISLILILMLVTTTGILYRFNQRVEQNIIEEVNRQQLDLAEAINIAQKSLSSTQWLSEFLKDRRLQGTSRSSVRRIMVVNSDGTVDDSSDANDIGKRFNELGFGNYKNVEESPTPNKLYAFDVQTNRGPVDLVIVLSTEELPQLLQSSSQKRVFITSGVLLLSILVSLILVLGFTRPVSKLVEAAKQVAAGNFDVDIPTRRRDEIGRLISVFNEMVVGLRERRDLEARLHRAEQSAIIGRLASGIAHEVKNPLNYISLTIDYLRSKYPPPDEADRERYYEKMDGIKDEIKRLDRLIRNFLSYGRPLNLNLKPVAIRETLSQLIALSSEQAEQQGIRLEVDNSTPLPQIEGDIERLKSCFSNLILNAQQSMLAGGTLTVSFRCFASGVEVTISDTGTGIDPEHLEKIFEPYFSTKETGTGLGLALVKRIVEAHGGNITVESSPGKGSAFRVWLPEHPPTSEAVEYAADRLAATL